MEQPNFQVYIVLLYFFYFIIFDEKIAFLVYVIKFESECESSTSKKLEYNLHTHNLYHSLITYIFVAAQFYIMSLECSDTLNAMLRFEIFNFLRLLKS